MQIASLLALKGDFLTKQKKEIKKDIQFYQENTEIILMLVFLYTIATGLFFYEINRSWVEILFASILLLTMSIGAMVALLWYLQGVITLKTKKLVRVHKILNKSWKVRSMLHGKKFVISIPSLSQVLGRLFSPIAVD